MKNLIVILGPTGVGKTELCLRVTEHFRLSIINADSRQIYREIPIGTAAPTPVQQQMARHYFVGSHSVDDYYSASMYEQDVLRLINDGIYPYGNKPTTPGEPSESSIEGNQRWLLTGGSMMYIDAVCNGIDDIPTVRDDIREALKKELEEKGLEPLLEELRAKDPEHYAIVDRKNYRRVIHALEICRQTGQTYTSFRIGEKKERPFRILKIGLNREREELYQRINLRVDEMMKNGFLEEVQSVYPKKELNSLNTVGYKELFNYLDGIWTLPEAIERIKGNTRRYMRKQLTWFKRDAEIHWFHPSQCDDIIRLIEDF